MSVLWLGDVCGQGRAGVLAAVLAPAWLRWARSRPPPPPLAEMSLWILVTLQGGVCSYSPSSA